MFIQTHDEEIIQMKVLSTSGTESDKIKIVVAGEAGNGKTTLARTIEEGLGEKVLIISAEAGLLSLKGSSIDYIEMQQKWDGEKNVWEQVQKQDRITRLAEVYHWLLQPAQQLKYQWVFIDSLTELSQNMLENLESQEEYQGAKNTIKKYGEFSSRMRSLCKSFRDMPHYNIVFSALVKNETNQDNQQKMKVSLIGSFADQLPALFDEIFYLGVTKEIDEQGRNIRKILTQKTDIIDFPKDRSGMLDRFEPADLAAIVRKIRRKPIISGISEKAKEMAAQVKEQKKVQGV